MGRALHSISKTIGPADSPGLNDVLLNNRFGVVMPAGIVDKLSKNIKQILTNERRGGLYCADVKLSSFARRDLKR